MIDGANDGCRLDRRIKTLQIRRTLPFEHIEADLVIGIERVAIDAGERRQIIDGGLFFGCDPGIGDVVAKLAGVAQIAAKDAADRIAIKTGFVAGVEQRPQLCGRGGGSFCSDSCRKGGVRLRHHHARRQQCEAGGQQNANLNTHHKTPIKLGAAAIRQCCGDATSSHRCGNLVKCQLASGQC